MPRRFDSRGWNRQFKWQPVRSDRWDPFPKDHLPFIDGFSDQAALHKEGAAPDDQETPNYKPGTDKASTIRQKVLDRNRKIRAGNAARKLHFEKVHGQGVMKKGRRVPMTHHEKVTQRLFYAGLGLATLGAGAAVEGVGLGLAEANELFIARNGIGFGRLMLNSVRSAWRRPRTPRFHYHLD